MSLTMTHWPITVHPSVSQRPKEQEIRAAERWLSKHEHEIPRNQDYGTVRINSDAKYRSQFQSGDVALDSSAEIEELRSAVPRRSRPRTEISSEALDRYIEPYLAIRAGMSSAEVEKEFGVTDAAQHVVAVEQWLAELASRNLTFNRAELLEKLARLIEKRKRDAQIGKEQSALRKARIPRPVEPESPKRGAEWATIDHISLSPPRKPRLFKRDKPTYGSGVSTVRANADGATLPSPADARAELADRTRRDMQDQWLGTRSLRRPSSQPVDPAHTPVKDTMLESGLLSVIEAHPFSAKLRKLVAIVDLVKAGKKNPEIAKRLNVPLRTVERYLQNLRTEGAKAEARELASRYPPKDKTAAVPPKAKAHHA